MKCPNCAETLLMTDRMGVEVDYCPKCRGIWLDKGELDKLLAIAGEQTAPPPQQPLPPQQHESYRQYPPQQQPHYYSKKKKKSFLSDFLDFD